MTPEEKVQLYLDALKLWGHESQIDMVIEEMAELTVELQHVKRGRSDKNRFISELVDVEIMLDQLNLMMVSWASDFREEKKKMMDKKLNRLKKTIDKEIANEGNTQERRA